MTFWHRLETVTDSVPGFSAILTVLQRLRAGSAGGDDATAPPDLGISFTIAIIALSAKLARSDGAVTIDEVEAFKRIVSVPPDEVANVRRLFDLAKQDVAGYETYARQIGRLLAGDTVLVREVMDALLVIAAADGVLHDKENRYLQIVAGHLGIAEATFQHWRGMFFDAPMGPYEILGVGPDASDDELRARHKALVKEHHPDRLAGLGCTQDFIQRSEQKLARVNAAFDEIARERRL